ncbi:MAG: hypothetical protein ACYC27_15400 [Armatimonadota bacterium]
MKRKFKYLVYALMLIAFCVSVPALQAAELKLAGVKLGQPAITIIQRYGNPQEVRIGSSSQTTTSTMPGMAGGMPGGMPMMPGMAGGMPAMPGLAGGMPGGMPGMLGGMPPMPTMPGMAGGMPAMPGMTGGTQSTTTTNTEVTWVYKFSKGRMLEFIINSQGRVLQISAYGAEWAGLSTGMGIKLGNSYKDVIRVYGWPEKHENKGIELIVKYPETKRVLFTLVDQTVVGITIALMD